MKKIRFVLMLMFILVVGGCGASSDENLIGRWESDPRIFTFSSDGTGHWQLGERDLGQFEWEREDGIVTLFLVDGSVSPLEYSIDEDTLILGGITYTRLD